MSKYMDLLKRNEQRVRDALLQSLDDALKNPHMEFTACVGRDGSCFVHGEVRGSGFLPSGLAVWGETLSFFDGEEGREELASMDWYDRMRWCDAAFHSMRKEAAWMDAGLMEQERYAAWEQEQWERMCEEDGED